MTFHHVSVALIPNAGAGFVVASCDTSADFFQPTEVTFEGVTYAVIGQAELGVSDDGLVVGNIGSLGNDGVRVTPDLPIGVADICTMPVHIPDNGRWGMQVFGETSSGRTALATVWNEAVNAEEHDILFDSAPEMNVSLMIVEYYLGGLLQHSAMVPLESAGNRSSRAAVTGRGSDGPTSVYVICINGELIVATDHNGDAPLTGCAGELPTNVPGSKEPVCIDFVRAYPIT